MSVKQVPEQNTKQATEKENNSFACSLCEQSSAKNTDVQDNNARFAIPKEFENEPIKAVDIENIEQKQEDKQRVYNKFLDKAKQAQQEKALQTKSVKSPAKEEKRISISAENIIASNSIDFDYSEDEEMLEAQSRIADNDVRGEGLFPENIRKTEEIDWNSFVTYCQENGMEEEKIPYLRLVQPELTKEVCYLKVYKGPTVSKIKDIQIELEKFLCTFLNRTVKVQIEILAYEMANNEELREKAINHPQIQLFMKEFGAELYTCYEIKHSKKS